MVGLVVGRAAVGGVAILSPLSAVALSTAPFACEPSTEAITIVDREVINPETVIQNTGWLTLNAPDEITALTEYPVGTSYLVNDSRDYVTSGAASILNFSLTDMPAVDFDTIYGPLRFGEGHENIGVPGVVLQVQNGAAVSVYPPEAAGGEIWYPMPAWDAR